MPHTKVSRLFSTETKATLSILTITLLPSLLFVSLKLSSLAAGLLLSSLIVAAANITKKKLLKFKKKHLITITLTMLFLVFTPLFIYLGTGKEKVLSSTAIIFIIFSAYIFSTELSSLKENELINTLFKVTIILLVLGWIGYSKITILGVYTTLEKPIPPFSEQSHYALALGLFSTAYCFASFSRKSFFILANLAALAILLPNLTLLVFFTLSTIALLTQLRPKYFLAITIAIPPSAYGAFNFIILKIDYFSNRLSFTDTENLTTLVWIQGWQLAYKNLLESKGVGIGMQMLGLGDGQLTDASHIIKSLTGRYFNLEDGGFLASKLISELGVAGIFLSVLYLYKALSIPIARGLSRNHKAHDQEKIPALNGIIFAFIVEFMFRGYGYFSPGLYIAISSWIAISLSKNKTTPSAPFKTNITH